ncbi:MAG: VOC family protein [Mesorhizobium sp.]|uniref:VOC family protein n=1 Tax=unclassified Mesorhizobium TaxID=325217 RepID=UPI000FDA6352|nr:MULTISPECIES: VOC family protein [unclassified Mesorhizobium]RWD01458.1 MAG: VOC family protein [Mesorhizobium sp.]RWE27406.1 MAG: VOC family protein [Mesorhizobium sp.]TGQ21267.1 VOC family protein [Mesorhizobium sp. M00.F.Ca.ET.217.01.1.1]TGV95225.1 VOC family protein [Mesorhizobium sp. M00.F.Ca.ET.158.01.1.1]
MAESGGQSFYFFDIDDNLLFLPTCIYLWNAETKTEKSVTSGEFAAIQNSLGRPGPWQAWSGFAGTFRDFRDDPKLPMEQQTFIRDLETALNGSVPWRGPSWPLLVHAANKGRAIAMVTARGHAPATIEAGLALLVERGHLAAPPSILGIYTVSNPDVRRLLGADDPAMTVPSVKKRAIKHAVSVALQRYGSALPHRFGMSDDDPNNVVLAVSAMRDCKLDYPDKRFFVINTNHDEYVKLEIFPMAHPVTGPAEGKALLADTPATAAPLALSSGGNASIYVTDIDRAVEFYTTKLGFPLKARVGTEWAEIDAGKGLVLGIHRVRVGETVAAGTRGAINIELAVTRSLDEVVPELERRGVVFKGEILNYPAVRIATVLDPDNNEILLGQVLDTGEKVQPSAS